MSKSPRSVWIPSISPKEKSPKSFLNKQAFQTLCDSSSQLFSNREPRNPGDRSRPYCSATMFMISRCPDSVIGTNFAYHAFHSEFAIMVLAADSKSDSDSKVVSKTTV